MNVLKLNWLTEHYAEIVLNRPAMKNAVNFAMIIAFDDALTELEKKEALKGLLIRGEGGSFCSGGDLRDFHKLDAGEAVLEKMLKPMTAVLIRIKNLPCPVISFVEGAAVGGGAELAASADRIYVTPDAKFGFIQVKLGIRTGWGGASLIQRHIDEGSADEMLRTGRIYSGNELKEFGFQLSHKPVDLELFEGVDKILPDPDLEKRMYDEAEECAVLWGSSIHGEKIKAFLEK
ncbi:enoyl-CoA hydratase/isomerase family protein [Salisediminibacterium selenitireducens]|uniref:Enoyl-CoA hydratase/isomerase n=1 Tax=Bacillus selenitireducens (strain ATCC 700615 / DSM 15326 / MLS10) TaxID=439292 RepID=D6XTL3_BACIE|nr:enoyl-CoA hydratase/isomerase family protein [Salisediminibacterium selenitireducens]ADH99149.1 Enoyl-CoA hydratase/isomerase [[Bacillus] selenitireducens MLS10]